MDLIIDSEILALTKPHIYKYSCFRLLLIRKARRRYATTASVPVIPSVEYTIGWEIAYAPDRDGGTCTFSSSPPLPGPLQASDAGRISHLN